MKKVKKHAGNQHISCLKYPAAVQRPDTTIKNEF